MIVNTNLVQSTGSASTITLNTDLTVSGDFITEGQVTITGIGIFNIDGELNVINGTGLNFDVEVHVQNDLEVTGGYNTNFTSTDSVYVGGDMVLTAADQVFNKLEVVGGATMVNNTGTTINGNSTFGELNMGIPFGGFGGGASHIVFNAPAVAGPVTMLNMSTITGTSTFSFSSLSLGGSSSVCGVETGTASAGSMNLGGTCVIVLPITLTYFNVENNNNEFIFNWQTVSEENNDFFTLEYSIDGEIFKSFSEVDGAGNSFEELNYEYTESNLSIRADVIYFRLKQTDFDGKFSYSSIVPISLDGSLSLNSFYLVPNPVQDIGTIKLLQFDRNRVYEAEIYNSMTLTSEISFTIANGEVSFDFSRLASGVYFIKVEGIPEFLKVAVH